MYLRVLYMEFSGINPTQFEKTKAICQAIKVKVTAKNHYMEFSTSSICSGCTQASKVERNRSSCPNRDNMASKSRYF